METQKILDSEKIKIIVDYREAKNEVFSNLKCFDAHIIQDQLKIGDYICSDRVCIERKTVYDFIESMIDQRIFKQASDMLSCFERPLFIIEGNPQFLFLERDIHPNAVRGILAALAIDYRIPLIWTKDAKETAHQIYWIARREQVNEKRSIAIRCPAKTENLSEQQEFLVAGLPFVNTKLSKKLLQTFKTPKRIFTAKPETLMKVEGIGEKKAKKIWEVLNKEYESEIENV